MQGTVHPLPATLSVPSLPSVLGIAQAVPFHCRTLYYWFFFPLAKNLQPCDTRQELYQERALVSQRDRQADTLQESALHGVSFVFHTQGMKTELLETFPNHRDGRNLPRA